MLSVRLWASVISDEKHFTVSQGDEISLRCRTQEEKMCEKSHGWGCLGSLIKQRKEIPTPQALTQLAGRDVGPQHGARGRDS